MSSEQSVLPGMTPSSKAAKAAKARGRRCRCGATDTPRSWLIDYLSGTWCIACRRRALELVEGA